jgi:hypothetical protein
MKDRIYEWMVDILPFRIMYHKILFDGRYIYRPRWGWTKGQLKRADEFANRYKNIRWD